MRTGLEGERELHRQLVGAFADPGRRCSSTGRTKNFTYACALCIASEPRSPPSAIAIPTSTRQTRLPAGASGCTRRAGSQYPATNIITMATSSRRRNRQADLSAGGTESPPGTSRKHEQQHAECPRASPPSPCRPRGGSGRRSNSRRIFSRSLLSGSTPRKGGTAAAMTRCASSAGPRAAHRLERGRSWPRSARELMRNMRRRPVPTRNCTRASRRAAHERPRGRRSLRSAYPSGSAP